MLYIFTMSNKPSAFWALITALFGNKFKCGYVKRVSSACHKCLNPMGLDIVCTTLFETFLKNYEHHFVHHYAISSFVETITIYFVCWGCRCCSDVLLVYSHILIYRILSGAIALHNGWDFLRDDER